MQPASDYQLLQQRRTELLTELREVTKMTQQEDGSMDIHNPKVPRYFHQEYPKILYHPLQLDPQVEERRKGILRRNAQNPTLAPLEEPHKEPLRVTVKTKEEEAEKRAQGFIQQPPFIVGAEQEGELPARSRDPLAESLAEPVAEPVGAKGKSKSV